MTLNILSNLDDHSLVAKHNTTSRLPLTVAKAEAPRLKSTAALTWKGNFC
jgi:hypothetical protein